MGDQVSSNGKGVTLTQRSLGAIVSAALAAGAATGAGVGWWRAPAQERADAALAVAVAGLTARVAVLEERTVTMVARLNSIDGKIDAALDRR